MSKNFVVCFHYTAVVGASV